MADEERRDKEAADDLDPAFDSIDATMEHVPPKEVTVTPEALAQIVNEAVAKAITAYEQSRSTTPDATGASPGEPAASTQARRARIEQLKGAMGIDEIEFEGPRPEPVEVKVQRELSSQMGVRDFEFEDAAGTAAAPDAPNRTETDAVAGWAARADASAGPMTPVQQPGPLPTPDVADTPAPAAAEKTTADAELEFEWVADELERLEEEDITARPIAAPPQPEMESAPSRVPQAVAKAEVRETLGSLANWFRSALGNTTQGREQPAVAPVEERAASDIAAVSPAPEPPLAAPPSGAGRTEDEPPRPTRVSESIFFTFDPIPPVPPRLPREPKDPPKPKKSGTFL